MKENGASRNPTLCCGTRWTCWQVVGCAVGVHVRALPPLRSLDGENTSHFHCFFLQYSILSKSNMPIPVTPKLAPTGASLRAKAAEAGTSRLAEVQNAPWAFVKLHLRVKAERKGHKQSFKRTLSCSGQLVSTSGSNLESTNVCLTLQHTLSLTNRIQPTSNWLNIQDKKISSSRAVFCSVCNNSITQQFMRWCCPFRIVQNYPYFRPLVQWFHSLNQRAPCSFTSYHIILTMWQKIPF